MTTVKLSELVTWAMAHEEEWARINGMVREARVEEHDTIALLEQEITNLKEELDQVYSELNAYQSRG